MPNSYKPCQPFSWLPLRLPLQYQPSLFVKLQQDLLSYFLTFNVAAGSFSDTPLLFLD